jgi:hypothetical protein
MPKLRAGKTLTLPVPQYDAEIYRIPVRFCIMRLIKKFCNFMMLGPKYTLKRMTSD